MPYIIAITGGSGSGKSLLGKTLASRIPDSGVFSYDSYYKDQSHRSVEERNKLNYDDPEQLDAELFLKHLEDIRNGRSIELPHYDFSTHTRTGKTTTFVPSHVVIIDGILCMSDPRFVKYYDFIVYVDADPDVRLGRRVVRDITERGRTPQSVVDQYLHFVKPMHYKYVEPNKKNADMVFPNNWNNGLDEDMVNLIVSHVISETKR